MAKLYHMHPAMGSTLTGACGTGKHHSGCKKGAFTNANEVSCTKRSGSVPKKLAFKCVHDVPDATIAKIPKGWLVVEDGMIGIVRADQAKKKSKIRPAQKSAGKHQDAAKTKKPTAQAKIVADKGSVTVKKTVAGKKTVARKTTVAGSRTTKGPAKKN